MRNQKQMMSSVRPDWNTPETVLVPVRQVLATRFENTRIDLDPCSNATSLVNAAVSLTEADDGLKTEWKPLTKRASGEYGLAFVNPPYGRVLSSWATKITVEGVFHKTEIIALVPARTDTKWFGLFFSRADGIAFWQGRLKFSGASSSAPFPSALIYFGLHIRAFIDAFWPTCYIIDSVA